MNTNSSQKNDISQGPSGVFRFYKNVGETLAVLLRRFKDEQGFDDEVKITYAGRLDPAAEGEMLLLVGEERHKKELYLQKNKTYELTILFGIQTDSLDLLGVPTVLASNEVIQKFSFNNEVLQTFLGKQELPYPDYSSKPYEGRPLFMYARNGKKIPKQLKKVIIYELALIDQATVVAKEVLAKVATLINEVVGDFRQDEIKNSWEEKLKNSEQLFPTVTLRVTCSSGTYMRSLAEAIGEYVGIPALTYHIKRTRILD